MKFPRRATTIAVAAASLLAIGAGSVSNAAAKSGSADAKVTINVAALRPGSSDEAQKQFNDNVALFEKQHPNIDVKAVEYAWNGATFAAQLAAGEAEDAQQRQLGGAFEIPPGAFVNSHESKNMYCGLLRPAPYIMDESKGFSPRIQFSWLLAKPCSCAWNFGSSGNHLAARRAAAASDASRAFSPCHQGAASLLCGKKNAVCRLPVLSCTNWRA